MAEPKPGKVKRLVWNLILLVTFFTDIWVPLYNRIEPSLFGVPFFYWFQFVWIVVAAAVTALSYRAKI